MVKTYNGLWFVTEGGLIDCDSKTFIDSFYPDIPDGSKAWFGSNGANIFGIFSDGNLWVFDHDLRNDNNSNRSGAND